MLYIIGLGLDKKGVSAEGLEAIGKCKKVYLENYTVDFPYSEIELEEVIGKRFKSVDREFVEGLQFIDEAEKLNVALLVYGSPLTATTHITIIDECKKSKIKYKVIYAGSVFDGILETGLQFYKFGRVASLPDWKDKGKSESFMEIVKENQSINAHSLILCDIGLNFRDALKQLEKVGVKEKLVLCQALGTKHSKIFYRTIEELREFDGVRKPYCIIIPGKLHFLESEVLDSFS